LFHAAGQVTVTVSDGAIGQSFTASSSTVEMTGGSIGAGFQATDNSRVQIAGGTLGSLIVINGSRAELSGNMRLAGNSVINTGGVMSVSGGTVNGYIQVVAGELNISGGAIEGPLQVGPDGAVNLLGRSFELNGVSLDSLTLHEPFTIEDRNVVLSGVLADGSAFSFDLNSVSPTSGDYFDAMALLTVSLILPGDFNNDGLVDAADYVAWRKGLGAEMRLPGDTTPGAVTSADFQVWRSNYGAAMPASASAKSVVPEPTAWQIAILGGFALRRRIRPRTKSAAGSA
jgi:hypothetical protein